MKRSKRRKNLQRFVTNAGNFWDKLNEPKDI